MKTKLFLILASMSLIFTACGERTREEMDKEMLAYISEKGRTVTSKNDNYSKEVNSELRDSFSEHYDSKKYDVEYVGGYVYYMDRNANGFFELDGNREDIIRMYSDDARIKDSHYKWCFVDDKYAVFSYDTVDTDYYIEDLCKYLDGEIIKY